ncbi:MULTISPECIES: TorF family putative porin [Pseudomonas]|uniref:TorF family putative porin n=1 Tax=Pseudomonas TaxID=286 RepID=UPI00257D6167|nr:MULTISPECIES: TorF family putative porin [Pseudomonas]
MRESLLFLALCLGGCASQLQTTNIQREVGDFDLKLGSAPTRSMAQGLVKPQTSGQVHGGFDLTHSSGWYLGQWAPDLAPEQAEQLTMETYAGFKHPVDDHFGYELGTLLNSYPSVGQMDVEEYYGGLTVFGHRLGASFSLDPGRQDRTLLANFDLQESLGFQVIVKYGNHVLQSPVALADGANVRVFNDWSVNLSRPWLGFDLNLSYSASSLSDGECSAYSGFNTRCDGAMRFQASRPL